MFFLKNNKTEDELDFFETNHRLIVYNTEQHTADICMVTDVTDTHVIAAGKYSIPKEDLSVHSSEKGRVYTLNAPTHIVTEVERLARLEKSIVLQQITNYKPPEVENPNLDMKYWALAVLLFIAIIVSAF